MRDFSTEQIRLAVSKHVLAMRTNDLLNLMNLRECGKLSSQKIQAILEKEAGWLKVSDDGYEVRSD